MVYIYSFILFILLIFGKQTDMTCEAALVKLGWLLAKYPDNPNKVRSMMVRFIFFLFIFHNNFITT